MVAASPILQQGQEICFSSNNRLVKCEQKLNPFGLNDKRVVKFSGGRIILGETKYRAFPFKKNWCQCLVGSFKEPVAFLLIRIVVDAAS